MSDRGVVRRGQFRNQNNRGRLQAAGYGNRNLDDDIGSPQNHSSDNSDDDNVQGSIQQV